MDKEAIGYVYDKMPETYLMRMPTARLRWKNGVLEQVWETTEYRGGTPIGKKADWMPVPIEE